MTLFIFTVNFWPILVGTILLMVLGFIWYSPTILFGKQWTALMSAAVERPAQISMVRSYTVAALGALVEAWVLQIFVQAIGAFSFWSGLTVGLLSWIGFVLPVGLGGILWERKPLKLYFINMGYQGVALLILGGLFGLWH